MVKRELSLLVCQLLRRMNLRKRKLLPKQRPKNCLSEIDLCAFCVSLRISLRSLEDKCQKRTVVVFSGTHHSSSPGKWAGYNRCTIDVPRLCTHSECSMCSRANFRISLSNRASILSSLSKNPGGKVISFLLTLKKLRTVCSPSLSCP